MTQDLAARVAALEAENEQLKQTVEAKTRLATRAVASYQQRSLQMEVIRQQNEDLDKLATDLALSKRNEEARAREAEDAVRLKSEFLANFSHEIRTPLNGIIGYCDLLSREEGARLTAHGRRDLNVVKSNAKTLLALINDILDLSKIEAGKVEVMLEDVDLEELAEECTATVREYLKGKSVELTRRIEPEAARIRTDGLKLRQVLLNLLSNAAKFTEEGEICLQARVEGHALVVEVEDTGIGMPPDQVPFIFEKFRQVDGSTTRKAGGTGLGLAIVRELSRVLGGNVSVKSVLGRGTTFTIRFAGMFGAATDAPAVAAAPVVPLEAPPLPRGAPILVVDDDPLIQQLVCGQLSSAGFEVSLAADGVEALRLARELRPVAIVLDLHLPRLDGWSVLSTLKGEPALAHTPVILMSVEEQRARGHSMGACDYLVKPVEPSQLVEVVRRAMGTGGGDVLVVDDDASMRELVSRSLRRGGFSTTEARNGEEALLKARISPPALVILDLMMPNLDGFEVMRRLRADRVNVPIVVLTGKELSAEEQTVLRDGFASFVLKGGQAIETVVAQARELLVAQRQQTGGRLAKILYVEDSDQNRDIVRRYLTGDFELVEAVDGEHGIERAVKDSPDLILMDMSLPRIDGWEATRRLRAMPQFGTTPVIALTAHAGREYQERAQAAGCNAFLTKPIERELLIKTIRHHLTGGAHG